MSSESWKAWVIRATAGVFSAAEVGATHQRKRVFILGMANIKGIGRSGFSRKKCGDDLNGLQIETAKWDKLRSETERCSGDLREEKLGNTASDGCSDGCSDAIGEESKSQQGRLQKLKGRSDAATKLLFPSRPGEIQQEWEEPRVSSMGDSKGKRSASRNNREESAAFSESEQIESGRRSCRSLRQSNGQAESKLGGTNDGSASGVDSIANRMDRLRSCGNGVVPQTAAKAFTTLLSRLL